MKFAIFDLCLADRPRLLVAPTSLQASRSVGPSVRRVHRGVSAADAGPMNPGARPTTNEPATRMPARIQAVRLRRRAEARCQGHSHDEFSPDDAGCEVRSHEEIWRGVTRPSRMRARWCTVRGDHRRAVERGVRVDHEVALGEHLLATHESVGADPEAEPRREVGSHERDRRPRQRRRPPSVPTTRAAAPGAPELTEVRRRPLERGIGLLPRSKAPSGPSRRYVRFPRSISVGAVRRELERVGRPEGVVGDHRRAGRRAADGFVQLRGGELLLIRPRRACEHGGCRAAWAGEA